ncbi:hypothetical protein ARNL5_01383 [Anaerolineae bacterium]|nr:hypothetical protein ARNL5_01383 [Anaerolineae bacterium]
MATSSTVVQQLIAAFPGFAEIKKARWQPIENVLPAVSDSELVQLEKFLNVKLPDSYKKFLRVTRGFSFGDGSVQFGRQHPFFHEFDKLSALNLEQQEMVRERGGKWPPPSDGMICFAEMFMLADGDQALFDVKGDLKKGEYAVYYYAHDWPKVIRIFNGFEDFMNGFLRLQEWGGDEPE